MILCVNKNCIPKIIREILINLTFKKGYNVTINKVIEGIKKKKDF